MKQFILCHEPCENGEVLLAGEDFHYLARVRRIRAGDTVDCRLPSGKSAVLRIKCIEKNTLTAECIPTETKAQTTLPPIILFQAIPKGSKMDIIVRQAGETGVSVIAPFYSERSIPRRADGSDAAPERFRRWQRILVEARQQSGSQVTASVEEPQSFDGIIKYWGRLKEQREKTLALLVHEVPLAKSGFHIYLDTIPESVVLAVGPEGGFSTAEVTAFMEAGFQPVTLGDTILRTESAALYSVAVVRTLIFERRMWTTMKQ
ncbi:MAG: 16S rRNA (uracil(1498)-N(3))-methyltransferase [Spirochaetaceae bacterium]|jgi:16S rRNA (uracil1498-N3)-methyltransferase|nr:16S rRNA (uracil(1498)-N(3))-methyltransferase [Spirochaetaceae bacterium]